MPSRRVLLKMLAFLLALPGGTAWSAGRRAEPAGGLVLVDGWILKASDLDEIGRDAD